MKLKSGCNHIVVGYSSFTTRQAFTPYWLVPSSFSFFPAARESCPHVCKTCSRPWMHCPSRMLLNEILLLVSSSPLSLSSLPFPFLPLPSTLLNQQLFLTLAAAAILQLSLLFDLSALVSSIQPHGADFIPQSSCHSFTQHTTHCTLHEITTHNTTNPPSSLQTLTYASLYPLLFLLLPRGRALCVTERQYGRTRLSLLRITAL